jgi:Domain of unknown function (DUF1707)
MDMPMWSFPRGDIRVSDAERDQAVAGLSEHFQAGRLTQEEFEDRSGRALQARTGGDLSGLFTDLPQNTVSVPTVAGPAASRPPRLGPGIARRAGPLPVARVVIACVIAAIILGGTGHDHGQGSFHASFVWLVPVVMLGFVFLRLARRRRLQRLTEAGTDVDTSSVTPVH